MLTLTGRGLISRVNNTASLTTTHYFQSEECVIVHTEIAAHGGLVAAVSGDFTYPSSSLFFDIKLWSSFSRFSFSF